MSGINSSQWFMTIASTRSWYNVPHGVAEWGRAGKIKFQQMRFYQDLRINEEVASFVIDTTIASFYVLLKLTASSESKNTVITIPFKIK